MSQTFSYENHLPELDGVRGAAILMILIHHCMPVYSHLPYSKILLALKDSTWIGVDLFFVLSGFLITRILIGLKNERSRYFIFYGRRSLRIFPLYYFILLIIYCFLVKNPLIKNAIELSAPKQWFFLYAYNIYILMNNSWAVGRDLDHFWSLCVEEQFYLFWPFLIFNWNSKKLPHLLWGAIGLSIFSKALFYFIGVKWPVIYTNTITRVDCFALGGLVAYGYLHWDRKKTRFPMVLAFLFSSLTLICYVIFKAGIKFDNFFTLVVITPIIAVFFSTLIYLVINSAEDQILKQLFLIKWLRALGKYSYGIYIYHWFVFVGLARLDLFQLHIQNAYINFVLVVAVTLITSVLSYHLLEKPFLKAKIFFQKQIPDTIVSMEKA